MQRLYKRTNSENWWVDFGKIDGARVQESTGCRDKRAADRWAVERERALRSPNDRPPDEKTLADTIRKGIAGRITAGRAAGTISMHEAKGLHLTRILGADTPLSKITAAEVDRYIEERLAEGAARSTIGKELSTLRIALKGARRRKEFPFPLDEVMPEEWSTDYEPRERFLLHDELAIILADLVKTHTEGVIGRYHSMAHRAAHIAFCVATSANWGESERARREDIDLRSTPGHPGGTVKLRGTKTKYRERTVPIVSFMRQLLELVVSIVGDDPGIMFAPWSAVRWDMRRTHARVAAQTKLEAAKARAAGAIEQAAQLEDLAKRLAKPTTSNDWRRTCGTWLRMLGIEPHLIASVLGHRDSRMVERVYGRMPADALGAALRARLGGDLPQLGPAAPKPTGPKGRKGKG